MSTIELNTDTILARIQTQAGDVVLSHDAPFGMTTLVVHPDNYHAVLRILKEDEQLGFTFLTTLCGLHHPETGTPFGIMVQLHNMPANVRVRVKTFTSEPEPSFPTLTDLWPAANWLERETYDFYGYRFIGHPDLRRILNMDSLEGWPLRKEYPLEDPFRLDKDDKMFGR
ncbi:MAG: NADH-quinone oxidoreductase subunit C [Bacteroidota bacterium]